MLSGVWFESIRLIDYKESYTVQPRNVNVRIGFASPRFVPNVRYGAAKRTFGTNVRP